MIGNYRIENLIGEGGMGVVYKATDTVLERTVAVKILHNHLVKDRVFYERFRNEAILLARLNHPNVTTLYNFSTDGDQSYMVMEYVEGITLEQLLKKEKVLSPETVIKIISAASKGLQHAHDRGILHRDIKSSNIMISEKGEVKLMDFGIAKMKGATSLTRVGSIIGTLEYMAPELLNGSPPAVPSDLYSMGVVMYELLTGKLPFEGNTEASLINYIIHQKPLPLRTYTTGVPGELENILDGLLRKKPERRLQSAEELRSGLEKVPLADTPPGPTLKKIYQRTTDSARRLSLSIFSRFTAQETYIMGSGICIAALILYFGLLRTPEVTPDVIAEEQKSEPPPPQEIPAETPSLMVEQTQTVAQEITQPAPQPKRETKTRSKSEVKPAEVVVPEVEKNQPKTEEKQKEVTYLPPAEETKQPLSERIIRLENLTINLTLNETVSSDDAVNKGQEISFRVSQDVFSQGVKVVAAGAEARGRILKVRSSRSGKSFLEIRPESVRAVNGALLKLKSPPLGRSGSTTEPVIFSKGIRVSPDPQIITTSIKLTI